MLKLKPATLIVLSMAMLVIALVLTVAHKEGGDALKGFCFGAAFALGLLAIQKSRRPTTGS